MTKAEVLQKLFTSSDEVIKSLHSFVTKNVEVASDRNLQVLLAAAVNSMRRHDRPRINREINALQALKSKGPEEENRLVLLKAQLARIDLCMKVIYLQPIVPLRPVLADEIKSLLRCNPKGKGKAISYQTKRLRLFDQVGNWSWPPIPPPNLWVKNLVDDMLSKIDDAESTDYQPSSSYILTAGNQETFLRRLGQYNERKVEAELSSQFIRDGLIKSGYLSYDLDSSNAVILAHVDINEDATLYTTDRPPVSYRDAGNYALEKLAEYLSNGGKLKDANEQADFEETRNQLRFKPKLEVRPWEEGRSALKLPRTFATGHFLQRLLLKSPLSCWKAPHRQTQIERRAELQFAPDIIGSTFNETGILALFKYLCFVPLGNQLTVDDLLARRYASCDRERMEMTTTPKTLLASRLLVLESFKGSFKSILNEVMRSDMKIKEGAFFKGNHSIVIENGQVLSGHPFTSMDDSVDNLLRLIDAINMEVPGWLDRFSERDINFIHGADDSIISFPKDRGDFFTPIAAKYKAATGVAWTETHPTQALIIDVGDVISFCQGSAVPIIGTSILASYDSFDRSQFANIYGMVACFVAQGPDIVSAFPLYDFRKILCSFWQPHSFPPTHQDLVAAEKRSKVSSLPLSQDEFASLRAVGINSVIGMCLPLNLLCRQVYGKSDFEKLDIDIVPTYYAERPAGADDLDINWVLHSATDVMTIWAPRLVHLLDEEYGEGALSRFPVKEDPDKVLGEILGLLDEIEPPDQELAKLIANIEKLERPRSPKEPQKEKAEKPPVAEKPKIIPPKPASPKVMSWEDLDNEEESAKSWADMMEEENEKKKEKVIVVDPKKQEKLLKLKSQSKSEPNISQRPSARRGASVAQIEGWEEELKFLSWLDEEVHKHGRRYLLKYKPSKLKILAESALKVQFSTKLPVGNLVSQYRPDVVSIVKPSFIKTWTTNSEDGSIFDLYGLRMPPIKADFGHPWDIYFFYVKKGEPAPALLIRSTWNSQKHEFTDIHVDEFAKPGKKVKRLNEEEFVRMFRIDAEDGEAWGNFETLRDFNQHGRFSIGFMEWKKKSTKPKFLPSSGSRAKPLSTRKGKKQRDDKKKRVRFSDGEDDNSPSDEEDVEEGRYVKRRGAQKGGKRKTAFTGKGRRQGKRAKG